MKNKMLSKSRRLVHFCTCILKSQKVVAIKFREKVPKLRNFRFGHRGLIIESKMYVIFSILAQKLLKKYLKLKLIQFGLLRRTACALLKGNLKVVIPSTGCRRKKWFFRPPMMSFAFLDMIFGARFIWGRDLR